MLHRVSTLSILLVLGALFAAAVARADIDPNSGIDLVRIGAPGNPAWQGGPIGGDEAIGRGSVPYEYSIGRFEVTTAQWGEFFNAVYDRSTPLNIPFIHVPAVWGAASATPQNPGGARWTIPTGHEMYGVGGITWRTAAIYCNWLCNNKSTDPSAFMNGAYDVSTFGYLNGTFTDQVTHVANARYWIPSWDEWIKAAHYDPNKNGVGQGGYWLYSDATDVAPISAPPPSMGGNGQINAGWAQGQYPGVNAFSIPLGAYTTVTSPWGLFDTGGATSEWTEEPVGFVGEYVNRALDGSSWVTRQIGTDSIARHFTDYPSVGSYEYGLRIASSVPAPTSGLVAIAVLARLGTRRRTRGRFRRRSGGVGALAVASSALLCNAAARADIDPNSGIDLVRIGAPGNAPWNGGPTGNDEARGRGSVAYEYSIGRFEVTTAQWTEFFNAVYDRSTPLNIPFIHAPAVWGAANTTPQNPGGARWVVPAGHEMYAVGGITWRTAAIYCNWLCNGKGTDPSAFMNGAYDVSTFGNLGQTFTDQVTHNANARYWIPTWDEWLKAAHYDPNRNGPGQGGYWQWSTSSDTRPISAPPPSMGFDGQLNAGWAQGLYPGVDPFSIVLGAYAGVTSPWGLFDTGGATSEWIEQSQGRIYRGIDGSSWVRNFVNDDHIGIAFGDYPNVGSYEYGLRIASSVPAPSCGVLTLLALAARARRRGRP